MLAYKYRIRTLLLHKTLLLGFFGLTNSNKAVQIYQTCHLELDLLPCSFPFASIYFLLKLIDVMAVTSVNKR